MSSRVQPNQDLGTPCRGAINQIQDLDSTPKLTERDFPFQTIPMRMLKVVVLQSKTNSIRPSLTFYQAIVAIYILIRAALNLVLLSSDGLR